MPDERRRRWPLVLLSALLVVSVSVSLAWPIYLSWRVSSGGAVPPMPHLFTESNCGTYCWITREELCYRNCLAIAGPAGSFGGDGWALDFAAHQRDPPRWARFAWPELQSKHGRLAWVEVRQFGFPLGVFEWRHCVAGHFQHSTNVHAFFCDPRQPLPDFALRCLKAVRWSALAVNALALWVTFVIPPLVALRVAGWLRRRARERRFQCVKCRYPIVDGAPRCPECGREYARPGTAATAHTA